MTWWQILLTIALLGALGYFFGFFDKSSRILNEHSPAEKCLGVVVAWAGATLVIYLGLAMWHKLLGPFIFGG